MVQSISKTFDGEVDFTWTPATLGWLTHVFVTSDAKPTTSESLTITLVNQDDNDLNVVLQTLDLMDADVNLPVIYAPRPIPLGYRDSIKVEYDNTDANTIGVIIKGTDGKLE